MVSIAVTETAHGLLAADIQAGGRHYPVFFKSRLALTKHVADALLLVALPAAMRLGEALELNEAVSSRLLSQVDAIQAIYMDWDKGLQKVDIHAPERLDSQSPLPAQQARPAISFTGGVDSFYSLLNTPDAAALFVHGLDIPLEKTTLSQEVSRKLSSAAAGMNRPFYQMETNIREFSDRFFTWQLAFGGVLAACALLLSPHLDSFGIPAGQSAEEFQPDGAHPQLNALFSNGDVRVETVGGETRRVEKVEAIAQNPLVQAALRVCWENRGDTYNCGVCEKCLRTMAALEIFSALEQYRVFAMPLDYGRLSRAVSKVPDLDMFIEENLEMAHREGSDPRLIQALEKALDPRRVWLFRLMHNKIPRLVYDRWYRIRRYFHQGDAAC